MFNIYFYYLSHIKELEMINYTKFEYKKREKIIIRIIY